MNRKHLAAPWIAALLMGVAAPASSADFHGFDAASFDGKMLSADALKAMVADLAAKAKPKNGKNYVIGFANLQRDIVFCVKVEESLKANADAAGVELLVTDNHLDGATALANAESFISRHVDYVVEFQTDANFGKTIMDKMNEAGIKVTAIDIPMPGATFFGANNPRSGFMGGSYLAQSAIAKFGADKVKNGYLIVGELPQSGPIPAMRTDGQIQGFLAVAEGFDKGHVVKIDTKNTLQESFTQTTNVLGRIPAGAAIMVTAINDQATTGEIRAVKQAGREADLIGVGMGADEQEVMQTEPALAASVGYFPERYGNYLVPMALSQLDGLALPPAVLMNHVMVNRGNICTYYPTQKCDPAFKAIDYKFPPVAFEKYAAELRKSPDLKDVQNLIPSN
jgi:ribose transport system substrate-binding protein